MSLTTALLFVLAGLTLLVVGGEVLVRGAIDLSRRFRVSTAVIGLTVVALATSLPELVVSLKAALAGNADMAIGNVVGSNMFNIALILGLSAFLLPPLHFNLQRLGTDIYVMMASGAMMLLFCWDRQIVRYEGAVLLVFLTLFMVLRVKGATSGKARAEVPLDPTVEAEPAARVLHPALALLLIVGGTAVLSWGADLTVVGAARIAALAGVSDLVIGLTLVSAGTGLPELTTAIVAAIRKHDGVALGNIIGSNIFNVCGILGTVALVKPLAVSEVVLSRDIWWMLGFSVVLIIPLLQKKLERWQGLILFAAYAVYVYLLVQTGG